MDACSLLETPLGSFQLRRAMEGEEKIMFQLLTAVAEDMVIQQRNQWIPDMFSMDLMREYLKEREVWILYDNDTPAGMFTLQDSDPAYWGERNHPDYSYLHRFAILPQYRGMELGSRMIDFAENRSKQQKKRGLRLDCVSHLPSLNEYYQGLGYHFVAAQQLTNRTVHLYEKSWVDMTS
ncbi:GNAT family N-acetyltransferase [Paenibacillus lemnae]|uniref:GNAT family N-acetyltransferase n=1 Tax=Paenibacillus lemnae TaxID=1330551 RepID=A0A848M594_PAELE|nr:GNAT family N-acetyltransferase [Paenibacillus lemnae]